MPNDRTIELITYFCINLKLKNMNYKPLGYKVLLLDLKNQGESKPNLILPEGEGSIRANTAKVIAIGDKVTNVKEGDIVHFNIHGVSSVLPIRKQDEEKPTYYLIGEDSCIYGVFEGMNEEAVNEIIYDLRTSKTPKENINEAKEKNKSQKIVLAKNK